MSTRRLATRLKVSLETFAVKKSKVNRKGILTMPFVGLSDIESWDGSDLALIRETITNLILTDGYRIIAVDLSTVQYIPGGFFGMLYEWYEQGIRIFLSRPRPNVLKMLWFRVFFQESALDEDLFQLQENDEMLKETTGERNKRVGETTGDTDATSEIKHVQMFNADSYLQNNRLMRFGETDEDDGDYDD